MRVLGIDEAGRGCVLGDLFIGAFCVDDPDEVVLRAAGADDSKRLSPKRRSAVRAALAAAGTADLRRVTPRQIDAGNLNTLEEEAIADLIRVHRPDAVFIDALGAPASLPACAARLLDRLPADLRPAITLEPKADATYAVVGAASVVAKTARDDALAALAAEHGPLGSGYPSDPVTRAWLVAHAATRAPWPPFVRTRWQTITDLAQTAWL